MSFSISTSLHFSIAKKYAHVLDFSTCCEQITLSGTHSVDGIPRVSSYLVLEFAGRRQAEGALVSQTG